MSPPGPTTGCPPQHPNSGGLHGQPRGAAKPSGDRGASSHPPTAGHQLDHQLGVGDVGAAHGGPAHTGALLGVHAGHGIWGTEAGDTLGPLRGWGPAQSPLSPSAPHPTGLDICPSLRPQCPDLGRGLRGEAGRTSRMEIHLCLTPASFPPPSASTQAGSGPAASPLPPAALHPAQLRSDLTPPSPPHIKASDSHPGGTSRAGTGAAGTRGYGRRRQSPTGRRCPSPRTGPGGFMHHCGNYLRMGSTQQLPGTRVAACQDHQHPITSVSQ